MAIVYNIIQGQFLGGLIVNCFISFNKDVQSWFSVRDVEAVNSQVNKSALYDLYKYA